eukprot:15334000-Ditylum_brightwellii.AAC.1
MKSSRKGSKNSLIGIASSVLLDAASRHHKGASIAKILFILTPAAEMLIMRTRLLVRSLWSRTMGRTVLLPQVTEITA